MHILTKGNFTKVGLKINVSYWWTQITILKVVFHKRKRTCYLELESILINTNTEIIRLNINMSVLKSDNILCVNYKF